MRYYQSRHTACQHLAHFSKCNCQPVQKFSILSADAIWRCISSKPKHKVDLKTNEVHQGCSWAFSKSCRRVNINCPQGKKCPTLATWSWEGAKSQKTGSRWCIWDAFPLVIWLPLWSHAGHVCPREARAIIPDNFPPFPLYPLFPPRSPVFSRVSRQLQPDNLHRAALLRPLCTICSWPHLPGQLRPFFPFIRKKGGEDKSLIMVARPHPTWGHELNFLQTPTFYLTAELGFTFYHLVGWTLDMDINVCLLENRMEDFEGSSHWLGSGGNNLPLSMLESNQVQLKIVSCCSWSKENSLQCDVHCALEGSLYMYLCI